MYTIHSQNTFSVGPLPQFWLPGGGLGGEVSLAERGAACITNVADAVIVKGERDEKKLAFVCVKGVADAGLSGFPKKMYDFVFDNLFSYTQKQ